MNRDSPEICDSPTSAVSEVSAVSAHRWVAWPAAERTPKTIGVVIIIGALSILVGQVGGDWLWGMTSALILVLSLNRWFLPTVFEIKPDCLQVGYPLQRRSIEWKRVRRIAIDSQGGWVSAKRLPSRFGSRDGFDIYWGRSRSDNMNAVRSVAKAIIHDDVPLTFTDHGDDVA